MKFAHKLSSFTRIFSFSISIFLLFVSSNLYGFIADTERNALLELYNQTNGPGWKYQTNWVGAKGTECTWYGVICNDQQNAVEKLILNSNQLDGKIPNSLRRLTYLKALYLCDNELHGPIPSALGQLHNLEKLGLSQNNLSGYLPISFTNLKELKGLFLNQNILEGPIPEGYGTLVELRKLVLSGNLINGFIPENLGNLVFIEELYL